MKTKDEENFTLTGKGNKAKAKKGKGKVETNQKDEKKKKDTAETLLHSWRSSKIKTGIKILKHGLCVLSIKKC